MEKGNKEHIDKNMSSVIKDSNGSLVKESLLVKPEFTYKDALVQIVSISFPTTFTFFVNSVQQILQLYFLNKAYDSDENITTGIGISNLYYNCTLYFFVVGLSSAFNILGGNAYGGKNIYLFGLYIHRTIIVTLAISILVILINFLTMEYGLDLFGAKGHALSYSLSYMKIYMFTILFEIFCNLSFRYLNIANQSHILCIFLVITLLLQILISWLLIIKASLGIQGSALSSLTVKFLFASMIVTYIIIKKPIKGSIFLFNKDSFKSLFSYGALAIPNAIIVSLEWWALEIHQIIIIYSGLGDASTQLDVQIVSTSIAYVFFGIGVGYFVSGSILLSRYAAEKDKTKFKKIALSNIIFAFSTMGVIVMFLIIFRARLFRILNVSEKIASNGEEVVIYLCIALIFQAIKSCLQSIMVGLRKQNIASIISFIGYYPVMIGSSYLLVSYFKMGCKGVWIAESIGYFFIILMFALLMITTNIDQIFNKIEEDLLSDSSILRNHPTEESNTINP